MQVFQYFQIIFKSNLNQIQIKFKSKDVEKMEKLKIKNRKIRVGFFVCIFVMSCVSVSWAVEVSSWHELEEALRDLDGLGDRRDRRVPGRRGIREQLSCGRLFSTWGGHGVLQQFLDTPKPGHRDSRPDGNRYAGDSRVRGVVHVKTSRQRRPRASLESS
jgi:hypothetical protein